MLNTRSNQTLGWKKQAEKFFWQICWTQDLNTFFQDWTSNTRVKKNTVSEGNQKKKNLLQFSALTPKHLVFRLGWIIRKLLPTPVETLVHPFDLLMLSEAMTPQPVDSTRCLTTLTVSADKFCSRNAWTEMLYPCSPRKQSFPTFHALELSSPLIFPWNCFLNILPGVSLHIRKIDSVVRR